MDIESPRKPRPTGARKRSSSERRSKPPVPAKYGFLRSFDGTKLFYAAEGAGPPLVFCYGLVCSSLHWTYQIQHFIQDSQKKYRAVWCDYRGHHNSEAPADLRSLTLPNIARDLKAVLDELKIEKPVLLGHSMGVNVLLEFYRQNPDRVAGMILANGTAQRPLETLFRHNILQAGFQLLKKTYQKSPDLVSIAFKLSKQNPITRTLIALGGFNPHLTPQEDIDLYVRQVLEMDPAILLNLIENYDSYDATAWLHTLKIPTLILAGEEDKVIPLEQQELMHQLIPESQLEIIRHGSHCSQMDLPDLVNFKIEQFLDRINYASTPIETTEISNLSTAKRPAPDPAEPS